MRTRFTLTHPASGCQTSADRPQIHEDVQGHPTAGRFGRDGGSRIDQHLFKPGSAAPISPNEGAAALSVITSSPHSRRIVAVRLAAPNPAGPVSRVNDD